MTTLPKSQQRREELVLQVGNIRSDIEAMRVQADMIDREIAGLDFAIAEAKEAVPVEQPKPPRLDIAAAIIDAFERYSFAHATLDAIARAVARKRSQVTPAIIKLTRAGVFEVVPGTVDTYRLVNREAAQAAE